MDKKISLKAILKTCWKNGPADAIYSQSYTTEVTHEQADYIENEGLGCERLDDEVDSDSDDYDPEEMETIRIAVEDYIDNNFKEDFFSYFDVDYFQESQLYTKEEIEQWINKSLYELCEFFCTFTVYTDEEIFLEVSEIEDYKLEQLNPDWQQNQYLLEDIGMDIDEFMENEIF